jgi:hypothetical protein
MGKLDGILTDSILRGYFSLANNADNGVSNCQISIG